MTSSSREASRPPWLLVTVVMTVGTVHWLPPASVAHANRSVPASDAKNNVQGTPDTTWTYTHTGPEQEALTNSKLATRNEEVEEIRGWIPLARKVHRMPAPPPSVLPHFSTTPKLWPCQGLLPKVCVGSVACWKVDPVCGPIAAKEALLIFAQQEMWPHPGLCL